MIEEIKKRLRISNNEYDTEVADLVDAAKQDMLLSGILPEKVDDEADALIKRAVTIYVKSHFGWDNPDADRLNESYNMLKAHLALSAEYAGGD